MVRRHFAPQPLHDTAGLLAAWRAAIPEIRAAVTPDVDGDAMLPNYGTAFADTDYARVPAADLPFGLPAWVGDDAWGRTAHPRHNNSVARPGDGPEHQLLWQAPVSTGGP